MKMSIIVPVYNVEKYLKDCLDSLINQNFDEYEIICVDDCSTDGSIDILNEYMTHFDNIRIVKNNKNGGLSFARNEGMKYAKGKYILFVDSDDWLKENSLERLYSVGENLGLDILYFNKEIFYEADYRGKEDWIGQESIEYGKVMSGQDFFCICAEQDIYNSINAYLQFFKRDFIISNQIEFYNGILHEDYLFFLRAAMCANKVAKIPDALYLYRKRNGAITEKVDVNRKISLFYVWKDILDVWKKQKQNERLNAAIENYANMTWRGFCKYSELCKDEKARTVFVGDVVDEYYRKIIETVINEKKEAETFNTNEKTKEIRYASFSDNEIIDLKNSDNIWIYGAGTVCLETLNLLGDICKIEGIIVTNSAMNKRFVEGHPIISIETIHQHKIGKVIIAVTVRKQLEIINSLKEHGINDYILACKEKNT